MNYTKFAIYHPDKGEFLSTEGYQHKWTNKPKMIQTYALIENAMEMLGRVHYHGNPEAFITEVVYTLTSTLKPVNEVVDGAVNKHIEKHKAIYEKLLPLWWSDKMKPKDYETFLTSRRVLIDAGLPVTHDDGQIR